MTVIATILIIGMLASPLIAFTQKMGQLYIHQLGQIVTHFFLYIKVNHLEKPFSAKEMLP
jgi:hypothetical protein